MSRRRPTPLVLADAGAASAAAPSHAAAPRRPGSSPRTSPVSHAERQRRRAARSRARRAAAHAEAQSRLLLAVGACWPFLGDAERARLHCTHPAYGMAGPGGGAMMGSAVWFGRLHPLAACQLAHLRGAVGAATPSSLLSARHVRELRERGFTVVDDFCDAVADRRQRLLSDTRIHWRHPHNPAATRDDRIAWFGRTEDPSAGTTAVPALPLLERFVQLRRELVSAAGLVLPAGGRDEYQLATYHAGARGYARHLDHETELKVGLVKAPPTDDRPPRSPLAAPSSPASSGGGAAAAASTRTSARVVSAVLYLNDDWPVEAGGALRLWPAPHLGASGGRTSVVDVRPVGGRMVLFLSGAVPHQVRPIRRRHARQARMALTAWFHN